MFKSAAVLVLDLSLMDAAAFDKACEICEGIILDKIIHAASDEMAVVLAGTIGTCNKLYEESKRLLYQRITVEHEMGGASRKMLDTITALRKARQRHALSSHKDPSDTPYFPCSCFDFIEALTVAADVLHTKTAGKKYTRTICFITEALHEVSHKSSLESLFDSLRHEKVGLTVIGVSFNLQKTRQRNERPIGVASVGTVSWEDHKTKNQNEEVLVGLCAALGAPSKFMSLDDAVSSFSPLLRRRRVQQRALVKVVLRIGEIAIATQLFTLAQQERLPALQRSTVNGATVTRTLHYEAVNPGTASSASSFAKSHEVPEEDVEDVIFFGADALPCSAADREAMKPQGPPSLEAVVFVKEAEVAPYVLMGGTRVLLPLAGDHQGQRGYNALAEAMELMGAAMLVRLVVKRDSAPVLCACTVQRCDTKKADTDEGKGEGSSDDLPRCLVMAPLPFAEDVRSYEFSEYPEIRYSAAEEQLMDDVIDSLYVDDTVINPKETFNPVLQQYYATLVAKLKAASSDNFDTAVTSADASSPTIRTKNLTTTALTAATASQSQVPQLLPQLQGTSTNFFVEGSVVYKRTQKSRSLLEACAAAFPYEENSDRNVNGHNENRNNDYTRAKSCCFADGQMRSWRSSQQNFSMAVGTPLSPTPTEQRRWNAIEGSAESHSIYPPSTTAAPLTWSADSNGDEEPATGVAPPSSASSDRATLATVAHKVIPVEESGRGTGDVDGVANVTSCGISSTDPVGAFQAMLREAGGCKANP